MLRHLIGLIIVSFILVIPHELGHLVAARVNGVATPRFSVGFGPVLGSIWIGNTELSLSALPLGGYVVLADRDYLEYLGEERFQQLHSTNPVAASEFLRPERWSSTKSLSTQFVIATAGVLVNFLIALAIIPLLLKWGRSGRLTLRSFQLLESDTSGQFIGPIQIMKVVSDAAERGLPAFLSLTARLSLGIGVLQLLPLPFFDGMHALRLTIQSVLTISTEGGVGQCAIIIITWLLLRQLYLQAKLKLIELRYLLSARKPDPLRVLLKYFKS